MAVIRGIGGAVDGIGNLRQWQIDIPESSEPWTVDGAISRVAGNVDWTGRYASWGHTPVRMPNDSFTFTGSIDGTNGATGAAFCTAVTIIGDIEKGTPIYHVTEFGANGALTLGAAAATDTSTDTPPPSQNRKLAIGTLATVPVFTDYCELGRFVLRIESDAAPYVSGCNAGQAKRVAGNIDAILQYQYWVDEFADLPAKNDIREYKVYVTATTFWDLKWMIVDAVQQIKVDREGQELCGGIVVAKFAGLADVSGTGVKGYIKKPDTTTWWPT